MSEKILKLFTPGLAHVGLGIFDPVKEFCPVFGVEGRQSMHQFIDEGAQAPPVDWLPMPLLLHNFRSEVLGRPADGHGLFIHLDVVPGEAKVGKFYVTIATN